MIEKEEEGEEGGNAADGGAAGDTGAGESQESMLERFVAFIERRKTVTLEELGAAFGLRA